MLTNKIFRNVISVLIVAAISLLCLFLASKLIKTDSQAPTNEFSTYFPDDVRFEEVDFQGDKTNSTEQVQKIYKVLDAENDVVGYGIDVVSSGFGGALPIGVAFMPNGEIISIHFGELKETPDLGGKISESGFYSQFTKKTPPLQLEEQIQGISGATISSKAVVIGVNQAANALSAIY